MQRLSAYDKIATMRRYADHRFRVAGALVLAFALAFFGLYGVAHSGATLADGFAVSAQSKASKAKQTKAAKKKKTAKSQPAQPPGLPARAPFSAADQDTAIVAGIPDARFWADSETEYLRALPAQKGPWLILSTGGEAGAFGAGLLGGWSASGKRPEFTLVTGVSTGALIAPYAFLGPRYDEALRDSYTTINSTDIFEIGGKGESLLDTWPLRGLIAKRITPELLKAIAAEHERGRRLLIVTTNLDAGRPVAWDIGAIALRADEHALELVRKIMIAAISIPGAFPPELIDVEANGRRFAEMHVDGGLSGQFYVAPDSMLASTSREQLPATDIYIIANMKLNAEFQVTERDTIAILGRTVSAAVKFVIRNAIDRVYATALRSGIGFHVAFVPADFSAPARGAFDPDYMKALYDAGFAKGNTPQPFLNEPPDFSNRPKNAAK